MMISKLFLMIWYKLTPKCTSVLDFSLLSKDYYYNIAPEPLSVNNIHELQWRRKI